MRSYFQIFGLQESFFLSEDELENKYIALQKEFHPDKLILKPEGERLVLATLSVDVNDGYHILKNPLLRSEYLLSLNGIIVNQDAKDTIKPDAAILMSAMESRELLDEAAELSQLKSLEADTKQKIKTSISQLETYYSEPKNLEKAALETINLKYLSKFLEDIKIKHKKFK